MTVMMLTILIVIKTTKTTNSDTDDYGGDKGSV